MSEFFNLTTGLSAYSKWVLIRLIAEKTSGDELSKSDLIKLGCPHNKFKKVIEELQEINAISKLEAKHFKRGRPTLSYTFSYHSHDKIDRLKFTEMLAKSEGLERRVPIKLVWYFFALNQDEYGYVESFSLPIIAKVCGLKNVEVKTAISKLIELNFIQQVIKGCTFKKIEIIGAKNERSLTRIEENNLKRSSCFKIIEKNQNKFSYLFTLPSITHFDSSSGRKKIYSLTGLLLDFYSDKGIRENVFLRLLRYEVSPFEHDFNFLYQQHKEVFRYFDEVLLKLVSMGISHLINGETKIKPVCQKDTFNHIFSPADYELSADNLGYGTSHLITKLANILIHYILYSIIYSLKDPQKIDGDIEKYLDSIQSLKSKDINIDALVRKIHSKVKFSDVYSIKNLTLLTNLDLTEKVNCNEGTAEFMDSKDQPTNRINNIFHIGPEIFEAFYINTLTSE